MELPSESDAQQVLAAALSVAAPSSSPSAPQRAFLARAAVSGPLGGDPSEPAVLEFLQRLAALEHGHALVACGAGRRLFRAAEAGSGGAGARQCMQLLADCAEAGALGAAGLCKLLHRRAASGDALTRAKALTLYAARANAPHVPVAAAAALCALCGQILEQWVRWDRKASQTVLLAAARAQVATLAAQLPRCEAHAAVLLAPAEHALAATAEEGDAEGYKQVLTGLRRTEAEALRESWRASLRQTYWLIEALAADDPSLASRGRVLGVLLAAAPGLPIGPRGLQALLAVATAGAPAAKADSSASHKAQEPVAVAEGIIAYKLLHLGGSSFLDLAARLGSGSSPLLAQLLRKIVEAHPALRLRIRKATVATPLASVLADAGPLSADAFEQGAALELVAASLSCGPLLGPALDERSLSRLLTKLQASVDARRVEGATARSVLAIVNSSLRDGVNNQAINAQLSKLMESYAMLACNGLHSECQLLQTRTCTRSSMLMPILMFARALREAGESLSTSSSPVVQQNFLAMLSILGSSMLSYRELTHQALEQYLMPPADAEDAEEENEMHDRQTAIEESSQRLIDSSYLTHFSELLEFCLRPQSGRTIQVASLEAMGKFLITSNALRVKFLPQVIACTRDPSSEVQGTALAILADCLMLPGDTQTLGAATECMCAQLTVPETQAVAYRALFSLCHRRVLRVDTNLPLIAQGLLALSDVRFEAKAFLQHHLASLGEKANKPPILFSVYRKLHTLTSSEADGSEAVDHRGAVFEDLLASVELSKKDSAEVATSMARWLIKHSDRAAAEMLLTLPCAGAAKILAAATEQRQLACLKPNIVDGASVAKTIHKVLTDADAAAESVSAVLESKSGGGHDEPAAAAAGTDGGRKSSALAARRLAAFKQLDEH